MTMKVYWFDGRITEVNFETFRRQLETFYLNNPMVEKVEVVEDEETERR